MVVVLVTLSVIAKLLQYIEYYCMINVVIVGFAVVSFGGLGILWLFGNWGQ